jgi:uncharacterized protein YaiI (UPF0178 family)
MRIIVDGDACPRPTKEALYRAAGKGKIPLIIVANTHIRTPPSPFFKSVSVPAGPDEADEKIVELVNPGDLVITADIPLADRVIKKGGFALDPRGEEYTEETIGSRLSLRNFMQEMREGGIDTGGPAPHGSRDREAFANALQRFLKNRKGS